MKKQRFVDVTISFEEFTEKEGDIFNGRMRDKYLALMVFMDEWNDYDLVKLAYEAAVELTTISATFDRELEDFSDIKDLAGNDVEQFITEYGYGLLLGEVGDYDY